MDPKPAPAFQVVYIPGENFFFPLQVIFNPFLFFRKADFVTPSMKLTAEEKAKLSEKYMCFGEHERFSGAKPSDKSR